MVDTLYEAAIQVSQDDRRLIGLLEYPVALVDHFGRVLVQNAAFEDCQSDTLHDPLKRNVQDFLGALDRTDYDAFLKLLATDPQAPETRFETTVVLDGLRHSLILSPLHADTQCGVILCQLRRLHPSKDAKLDDLMEHFDLGIWEHDIRAGEFSVSKVWRAMRGIADDAVILGVEDDWLDDVHPDDRQELRELIDRQVGGLTDTINVQYRQRHAEGHWIWVLCRAKIVEAAADGRPLRIVGTDTDVTAIHRRENALHHMTNKLKLAIDVSEIGVWEFDPVLNRVHWDDRLLEIYGRTGEENLRSGDSWETYVHPDDRADLIAAANENLQNRSDFRKDFRIVRPDGEIRHIRSLSRFTPDQTRQDKLVGVNIDITEEYQRNAELEEARSKLEYDSRHDALTGLANRRLLDERTSAMFADIAPADRYAVLHIDLDHFKQINDTLGHAAGDAVLVHVANQLCAIVAKTGLTARSGGDEFVVLFEQGPTDAELHQICNTIIRTFRTPFVFDGQDCAFGVSIGCAVGQGSPEQANEIFIQADAALYAAKQVGRGCYRFFSAETSTAIRAGFNARQCIVDAMANDEIICYFQPQYAADGVQIIGAEALVRWQCPHRGLLTPDAFMWQADHADLTERIDAHVFAQVAAQQSRWFAAGVPYPPIAINVSKARFAAPDMIDHVRSMLKPHHAIAFELLETAFLDDLSKDQLARIAAIRQLGIGVDLDDFGSGHSSVAAMQAVRPDRVKIDQSLVGPITFRAEQLTTLKLLTKIARLEGVGIVIEGLDTAAHLEAIKVLDCDALQGYALQVPMSADAFEKLLRA